jgi:N-glycosylase/DNA lyase
MEAVLLPLPAGEALDLEATLRCGQAFRWRRAGEWWYGPHAGGSLALRLVDGAVEVRTAGCTRGPEELRRFLDLDRPLTALAGQLGAGDPSLARAATACRGLRLLRQDPWECLLAFICSQNSHIPKIEASLERLASRWGVAHAWAGGPTVHTLPSAAATAEIPLEALASTGLGYRCRYVRESARRVADGLDLEGLRGLPYEAALSALLSLPGVGRKVADCVLLFALDQPAAFPVDVWVRRALHRRYPAELAAHDPSLAGRCERALSAGEYESLVRFARNRWGEHAGYAQQWLFHNQRAEAGSWRADDPGAGE